MKPELPPEIISIFPQEIVDKINSFVPHFPNPRKSKTSPQICTYSLQMNKDLPPSAISKYTPMGCACYGHRWVAVVIKI
jgi:hypothetical protein